MPDDGQAWQQLGLARYELRDLPGAETALLQSASKTDNSASSMFMLAVIAVSQGRTDTAFERLDRAVDGAGDDPGLDRAELRILQSDSRWAKILEKIKRGP